jgi:SecA DEAD-like domain
MMMKCKVVKSMLMYAVALTTGSQFSEAFTPTTTTATTTTATGSWTPAKISTTSLIAAGRPAVAFINPISSSVPSSSALQMGVVENFITTSDAKTRKSKNDAYLKELQKRVDTINALETDVEELSDEELQAKTEEFRKRLSTGGEDINGPILEEMFAVVREAAWYVVLLL